MIYFKKYIIYFLLFLFLFLNFSCNAVKLNKNNSLTPHEVSYIISNNKKVYSYVDIYVEYIHFDIIDQNNEEVIVGCVNSDKLQEEFLRLNEKFSPINLEFVVNRIIPLNSKIYFQNNEDFNECLEEKISEHLDRNTDIFSEITANSNKNICSLFFQFTINNKFSGLSKLPYWEKSKGILIAGPRLSINLLSHEFGHYYGLLHTFHPDGDFIADTVDGPVNPLFIGTIKDPNINNIMTYSLTDEDRCFTKGQYEMMKKFMISFRNEELYSKKPTSYIKTEELSQNLNQVINSLK